MPKNSKKITTTWAQLSGRWRIDGNKATYLQADNGATPFGLCLSSTRLRSGTIRVKVHLSESSGVGRVAFGHNAETKNYYSIGLGGYNSAYVLAIFEEGRGWLSIENRGMQSQLEANRIYDLEVRLLGQRVSLVVDGVQVFQSTLRSPLKGDQVGLFAWGKYELEFTEFKTSTDQPNVFVVMQFGEPYDDLYREVIKPACSQNGYKTLRADDVFRPGVILQDIRNGIIDSDIVIAEITPVNANVFYELGYAHALDKPTILLANRKTDKLPFDISGYRVIFYDDTIGGKSDVELTLIKHLKNIRNGQEVLGSLEGGDFD